MRYTIVEPGGTVSFIAPWNTLKALVAACSRKPAPSDLSALVESASKYSSGLQDYVLNGLAIFDEHHASSIVESQPTTLSPTLENELQSLLAQFTPARPVAPSEPEELDEMPMLGQSESEVEISYEALLQYQVRLSGAPTARQPVLRVLNSITRQESLEPVGIGLVIFNLPARRIVQVQNSYGVLKRSDRGRYFENGQPTERLYFYRLPNEWSLLP